jgi:hypothetical protein
MQTLRKDSANKQTKQHRFTQQTQANSHVINNAIDSNEAYLSTAAG